MAERAAEILGGDEGASCKAQTTVSLYYGHVIKSLVHVLGKSESEVVRAIIDQWMVTNREYLRELGLHPPTVRAGKAVVVPPGAA
jgi:hypothetical protein